MTRPENLFWDSCVFIAFLNEEAHAYDVPSIEQYLEDARQGKCRIYGSTLSLAEVRPTFCVKKGLGSFSDFIDDVSGEMVLIDPSPTIMEMAGYLKDIPYQKTNSKGRQLATPDAIMLATGIHLVDDLGVKIDHFHTFDNGKRRGLEGKSVPLLTYEEWCPDNGHALAAKVKSLPRHAPIHPAPQFNMKPPGKGGGEP